MRGSVEADLTAVETDLDKEAADDDELRQRFGTRWTAPPSAALTKQLRDKILGYRNNLAVAGESDTKLMDKLNASAGSLGSLSMADASKQLPRLQAPMVPVGDVDPVTLVNTLRQAMETMQQLSSQRALLEESLKVEALGHFSSFWTAHHTVLVNARLVTTFTNTGGEKQGQHFAQTHGICRQLRGFVYTGGSQV